MVVGIIFYVFRHVSCRGIIKVDAGNKTLTEKENSLQKFSATLA
jgi:hypothetical protein